MSRKKKVNIFEKDVVFIPLNLRNSHWALLAVYTTTKKIYYYDSMYNESDARTLRQNLLTFLVEEAKAIEMTFFKVEDWDITEHVYCPQQDGSWECGVFTIMVADFLSDEIPLDIRMGNVYALSSVNEPFFRAKIATDIKRQRMHY